MCFILVALENFCNDVNTTHSWSLIVDHEISTVHFFAYYIYFRGFGIANTEYDLKMSPATCNDD